MKIVNSFVLLLSLTAAFPALSAEVTYASLQKLYEASRLLASGDLSCAQASDCTSVEIGSRACGGPQEYLVTSNKNANLDDLKILAASTTRKEDEYNQTSGGISICSFEMPPQLSCVSNVCTAN